MHTSNISVGVAFGFIHCTSIYGSTSDNLNAELELTHIAFYSDL